MKKADAGPKPNPKPNSKSNRSILGITYVVVALFLAIPYWKGKYAHVKVPAGSANAGAKTGGDQDA